MPELEIDIESCSPCDDPPAYLVLEQNPIIADDIIGAIKASGPCDVMHVSRPEVLSASLAGRRRLTAAFLEMKPSDLILSGLDKELQDQGAHIVLTVGEEEESNARERGFSVLRRPFSEQMLQTVLAEMKTSGSR